MEREDEPSPMEGTSDDFNEFYIDEKLFDMLQRGELYIKLQECLDGDDWKRYEQVSQVGVLIWEDPYIWIKLPSKPKKEWFACCTICPKGKNYMIGNSYYNHKKSALHNSILNMLVVEEQILYQGSTDNNNNNNNNNNGSPSSSPKSINSSSPDRDPETDATIALQSSMDQLKIKELDENLGKIIERQDAHEEQLKGLVRSTESLKDDLYHKKDEEENKRRKGEISARISRLSIEVTDEQLQGLILEVLQKRGRLTGGKIASLLRNDGIILDGSKRVNRVLHTQLKPLKKVVEENGEYSLPKN